MTITIKSLSHEGRGIAIIEDKTTFIDNALPEEIVVISSLKKRRRYDEAKAIEILHPSKNRVTPPCEHFTDCGGCSLQHIEMQAQLLHKEKVLLENLHHFGKVTPAIQLPPLQSPKITGYRRKARLGVRYVPKKGGILVGFREKSSNKLAKLNACAILHPSIGKNLLLLKEFIESLEAYSSIPQIEVAIGDTITALVFRHMQPLSESDHQKFLAFAIKTNFYIYLQPGGQESIHLFSPKNEDNDSQLLPLTYSLPDYGITFHFKPQDFTQVNAEINQAMVKNVVTALQLEENESVLDLYCGLGNFTLPLAKFVKYVVGVEGNAEMTNRATFNAKINHLTNTEFQVANLENGLSLEIKNQIEEKSITKVLLDPPRTGAYHIVSELALMKNIQKIVYVSCNPATLARDIGVLVHKGEFQFKSIQALDMFPHTAHIESISVLEKNR